jgi:hypothetical protein
MSVLSLSRKLRHRQADHKGSDSAAISEPIILCSYMMATVGFACILKEDNYSNYISWSKVKTGLQIIR